MSELIEKCELARNASFALARVNTITKNNALSAIADALISNADKIIEANKLDLSNAENNGMAKAMLDRLTLTKERITDIAEGVRQVAALNDPIGEVINMQKRPNGLLIGKACTARRYRYYL